MNYEKIVTARFLARPNRFIAYVEMADGTKETVHVKNTGRCRELLTEGATVFLEESANPDRKTRYDLVAVMKGSRMINMDSGTPNRAVEEWLNKKILFPDIVRIRPETTYKSSRFDFYVETGSEKIFIEVKGVTLEKDNVLLFPDAPSERAVKHVHELIQAKKEGYGACILFVIQMEGAAYFTTNEETHPAFCQAVREAKEAGVKILAYDCHVWQSGMWVREPVKVVI